MPQVPGPTWELTLDDITRRFDTDDKARSYLEGIRWPNGVICPHCRNDQGEGKRKIYCAKANVKTKVRPGLRQCGECDRKFTVTVGMIFEDTHVILRKWLIAWYLLASSKKGISALQIQRMLALGSYRTAWLMMHKIRHALRDPAFDGMVDGTVEADERYIGGRPRGMGRAYVGNKAPVVSLVERGGRVRSTVVLTKHGRVTGDNLKEVLTKNIAPTAKIMTDSHHGYKKAAVGFASHETVNHNVGEYGRGNVYTNTVEGYFSLLKRGIVGTFHHVSRQHLPLYLADFDHRYNHRTTTDGQRALAGLRGMEGKRLTYRPLVAAKIQPEDAP